jgi:hypothetical protein
MSEEIKKSTWYWRIKKNIKCEKLWNSMKLTCTCGNQLITGYPFEGNLVCRDCQEELVTHIYPVKSQYEIDMMMHREWMRRKALISEQKIFLTESKIRETEQWLQDNIKFKEIPKHPER